MKTRCGVRYQLGVDAKMLQGSGLNTPYSNITP